MPGNGTSRDQSERAADLAVQLADRARLPVIVIDPKSSLIQSANEQFEEVFGWDRESLVGERYHHVVHEGDVLDVRDLVSLAAYGGSCDPVAVRLREPGDGFSASRWLGVPNVLEDPTEPVAILCRPKGKAIGKPLGPPEALEDTSGEDLERIPPHKRIKEDRKMTETSRFLWGSDEKP